MATQLFFRSTTADVHLGTDNLRLRDATGIAWRSFALDTSRGSSIQFGQNTATVAGPTSGLEASDSAGGGGPSEWISPPVDADVTISGTITANIWALESSMNANAAVNVIIEIIRANATGTRNSNTLVEIVRSTFATELGTSRTANNFTTGMTSGSYTSQTLNKGDRLRIRVFFDDGGGTMASGFTCSWSYDGGTAGADGDSYVTFTENFSFMSAPSGSVIYPTDTASPVSTASVDREAWTSRGAGVQTDVRNTAAGWTAPLQITDTAGGTVVDWFTRPLAAFTLGGMAQVNVRAAQSATTANACIRCEIARVDGDGTNPTVWATWLCSPNSATGGGELSTSEGVQTINVSGDDLAISDGQRLRIRFYIDDVANAAMGASQTVTLYYAGTSGGASGDTFVTLPQTVSEFVAATFMEKRMLGSVGGERQPQRHQGAVGRASVW